MAKVCQLLYENTINMERFAGVNIRGFSPIKFFTGILSQCLDHQCSFNTYLTIAMYIYIYIILYILMGKLLRLT